jgi:CheY-like chemotaxis protein
VLLVDDEEVVRISTAEILHDLGYEVTEAGSAREAMQQITSGLLPDLLVTDHLMSGVTGTELARSVVRSHPKVQVLIISGYSEVDEIATDLPRLAKPFRKDELAAALERLQAN